MPRTRSHRITPDALAAAVKVAVETSLNNAERACCISAATIRKEMRRLNIPRRRIGTYAQSEHAAIIGKLVGL
jgi:hypothetical protein